MNFNSISPAFLIAYAWLTILTLLNLILFLYYRRLTQGVKQKNIFSVLNKLTRDFNSEVEKTEELGKKVTEIEKDIPCHLQKIGLVRFNPFAETGGNQSFCLALLDDNDNGLVISSLHSRETTRVYAKPVKTGQEGGYLFSAEEKRAVQGAKKIKK